MGGKWRVHDGNLELRAQIWIVGLYARRVNKLDVDMVEGGGGGEGRCGAVFPYRWLRKGRKESMCGIISWPCWPCCIA